MKKAAEKTPDVRHASQWLGRRECGVRIADPDHETSHSLVDLSDIARRAGFKPSDARLVIDHEQGRAYVCNDSNDPEGAYADVDACEWRAELVFPVEKCAFCQKAVQLKAAKLKKRNADRRTLRQRRASAA